MLGSIKAALASIATSIKSSLPTVVAATTATVLTGGCIYYYTVKDGGYERNNANVRYVIEEYMNQITLDSIKPNGHDGYAYSTNFNEMVDEIIKKLDEADSVLGSYTGEEKKKEVVEKLIRAELLTQYPDLRSASEIARNKKVRDNELQGGIKIIKRDSTKDTSEATADEISQYDLTGSQILTYIPYNDFKDKLSNADGSITNYYSLKPSSVSSSLTANFVVKTDAENAAPVLNRNQIIQVIQTHYTGNARTNLLNQLNKIMSIQENSKINAVFLMAVAEDMSSCGTIWVKYTSDSYNWLGVKDASYTSLEDATSKFEELISGSEYFGASKYNVSDIASTYNSAAWGNNINEKMAQIYNSIGIDIEESDNVTNTTQTDTSNSIDLVVATSTSENTTVTTVDYMPKEDGTGDEKTENTEDKGTTYTYKEVSINYQNMLSKYSMPAGFLWSLMVMGENVDFVLNLANLVIDDTVIIIEAQDSVSVTVNEQVMRYRNTKTVTRKITTEAKPEEEITDGPIPRFTDPINTPDSSVTTTVTTTQSNTRLNLTYAKTWVATYRNRYKNNVNADAQIDENWVETAEWTNINPPAPGEPETRVSEDPNNDSEYEYMKQRIKDNITWDECIGMVNEEISILTIYDSLYYLFKKDNNSELSNLCASYMYNYIKGYYTTSQETDIDKKINDFWKSRTSEDKQFFDDNGIDKQELRRRLYNLIETKATTVITLKTASTTVVTSQTNLKTASNVQTINKNTYTSAGTEVQERTEIDKDKNFVTYFNKSGRAKEYILQSPEWFYEMLESHPKTANMIDLFKYLLYKATNNDYGVTTFDFTTVNNFGNMNYISGGSGFWWPIGSGKNSIQDTKDDMPELTYITSEFGPRWGTHHDGIDIAIGDTVPGPYIIAAADGVATVTGNGGAYSDNANPDDGGGYGNWVEIDHGNGYTTFYAHMAKDTITVKNGDTVKRGQVIGRMGNSGHSTGVHLHFEIRLNGEAVDPEEYVSQEPEKARAEAGVGGIQQFIATFEGGTEYYNASTGEYEIFTNGLDNNIELTGGVAVGTKTGGVDDTFKKLINRNDLQLGSKINQEEYNKIFTYVYNGKVEIVNEIAANLGIVLSQQQIDATISFCYNAVDAYYNTEDLLTRYKNEGERGYWDKIHDFTHSLGEALPGLVRRRAAEMQMFLEGDYVPDGVEEGIQRHRKYNLKYGFPEYEGET